MTIGISENIDTNTGFTGDVQSSLFLNYVSLFVFLGLAALNGYFAFAFYKTNKNKKLNVFFSCYPFLVLVSFLEFLGYLVRVSFHDQDSKTKVFLMAGVQQLMVITPFFVFFPPIMFLVYHTIVFLKCPNNTRATFYLHPVYSYLAVLFPLIYQLLKSPRFKALDISGVYLKIKKEMILELISMLLFVVVHLNFVSCYKKYFATESIYRAIDKKWQVFNVSLGIAETALIFRAVARIVDTFTEHSTSKSDNDDYWLFFCESLPVAVSVTCVFVAIPNFLVFQDFFERFDNDNDNDSDDYNTVVKTKRATLDEVFDLDE